MNRIFTLLAAVLITVSVKAQIPQSFVKVDYKDIKTKVMESPVHVRELVDRLAAEDKDFDLTPQEKVQAFYGQSYITNDGEEFFVFQMREALRIKDKDAALQAASDILAINKLNLDAIITKAEILAGQPADSTGTSSSKKEVEYLNSLAERICEVIFSTGDGTANHPFFLTKAHDEYNFLNKYLKINKVSGAPQQMGNLDVLHLEEKSAMFEKDAIYFDITRVQELEKFLENQQKQEGLF